MTRTSTIATLDAALGGQVSDLIRRRRAEGATVAQIRDDLRETYRFTVSERTVQRYVAELPPEPASEGVEA